VCPRHGLIEFHRHSRGRGYYSWRCKRCVGEAVTRRKQKVRRILVAEAGGRCAVCGYDACVVNLSFHHVDPATKALEMSMKIGRSLAAFRAEAEKCVLVCANCHGEIETGLIPSPPPQATFASYGRLLHVRSAPAATICAGKEMATSRSDKTQVDACEEVARGLSPDKRAAWVGFMKTHAALTKALDADLIANVGIPLSAFEVLFGIAYSDEGYLRMSEVAEQAMLSPSRVSRLVTELERRGYLERRTCESDSRVVYAAITDEGRELLAKVEKLHFEGIERRFFSALSAEQVAELAELWPRVLDATGTAATTS
jgi:DNA-binding MarR family transcriptional regulator